MFHRKVSNVSRLKLMVRFRWSLTTPTSKWLKCLSLSVFPKHDAIGSIPLFLDQITRENCLIILQNETFQSVIPRAHNEASACSTDPWVCLCSILSHIAVGPERKSKVIEAKNRELVAYHEGGHALVALYTPEALPIHKATIVPRGQSLGMVSIMFVNVLQHFFAWGKVYARCRRDLQPPNLNLKEIQWSKTFR